MRTHQDIVKEFGASKLAHELNRAGAEVGSTTPQRWADRDRIPPEYWTAIVDLGAASLDELSASHRPRKRRDPIQAAA